MLNNMKITTFMPVYVLVCLEKCTLYVSKNELPILSWNRA